MIDIQKLKQAAEDAGSGIWHWDADKVKGDAFGRTRYQVVTIGRTITQTYYSGEEAEKEAVYIASACPATILELIARLESAERQSLELKRKYDERGLQIERLEKEVINTHSSLAGAVLHAAQGWARYESANRRCIAAESMLEILEGQK